MAKYTVLVNMDLNVELLDSTSIKEVEKITKNVVRILVDKKDGCEIKSLRAKLLGKAERFDG